MGKQWKQWQFIFWISKVTVDGDCSHEIKRHLLLGRKVMTKLDSIFESRDITLPTKFHIVQTMVFWVVMYGCESWTIKKSEHQRIDAFKSWCWRRLLRVPWTARTSNQSILKEIHLEYSLEDWCWSWSSSIFATWCEELIHWKIPWCWKDWGQEEKGMTEEGLGGITDSMDMNLSKLREIVKDREAWHATVHGVTKSRTRLGDWTELNAVIHNLLGTKDWFHGSQFFHRPGRGVGGSSGGNASYRKQWGAVVSVSFTEG